MTKQLFRDIALFLTTLSVLLIVLHSNTGSSIFGATSQCASSQTCFSSIELTGATNGATNSLQVDSGAAVFSGTTSVGDSGTALSRVNSGTCFLRPYAATIVASTTALVDCQATAAWNASAPSALTGITAGDSCQLTLSTSTAGTTFLGVQSGGASASTTAGYIQINVNNGTGGTFTWPTTGTASGTAAYLCTR